jgi:tetratricopeptide (TPR) repeat protein
MLPYSPPALQAKSVLIIGRLHGIRHDECNRLVRGQGGRIARHAAQATTIVIAESAIFRSIDQNGSLTLPNGIQGGKEFLGERAFKRMLGVAPEIGQALQPFTESDLARVSRLSAHQIICLRVSDLLQASGEGFTYQDLVVARRTAADWGQTLRQENGRISELDGQYVLPLNHRCRELHTLIVTALHARRADHMTLAERFARAAIHSFPGEVAGYDALAWALIGQDRFNEAVAAWHSALKVQPESVEVWCDLGDWAEEVTEDSALATRYYERALAIDPECRQALLGLPLSLLNLQRYEEAAIAFARCRRVAGYSDPDPEAEHFTFICQVAKVADYEAAWIFDKLLYPD